MNEKESFYAIVFTFMVFKGISSTNFLLYLMKFDIIFVKKHWIFLQYYN